MSSSSKKIKFEQPSHTRPATTSSRNDVPNAPISNQAASSSATETARREIPHSDRSNNDHQPTVHGLDDEFDDDLFGLHERRMNRKKSREQSRRPDVKREVKEESRTIDFGSIPSFF
jgi:hypothetical protein